MSPNAGLIFTKAGTIEVSEHVDKTLVAFQKALPRLEAAIKVMKGRTREAEDEE
jgi:hypothetical protein